MEGSVVQHVWRKRYHDRMLFRQNVGDNFADFEQGIKWQVAIDDRPQLRRYEHATPARAAALADNIIALRFQVRPYIDVVEDAIDQHRVRTSKSRLEEVRQKLIARCGCAHWLAGLNLLWRSNRRAIWRGLRVRSAIGIRKSLLRRTNRMGGLLALVRLLVRCSLGALSVDLEKGPFDPQKTSNTW